MKTTRILSAVPAALALVGLLPAAASAAPAAPTSSADILGVVRIDRSDPNVGYVNVRYRCTGEGGLWISVKQTAERTADPRLAQEGSSAISAAWSDSHRNPVTCNGRWQTQRFTVDHVEPMWGGGEKPGPLAKGEGYVQFCLFDDTSVEGPLSRNEFLHVR